VPVNMALRNASMSLRMKQLVTEFLTAENASPIDIHRKMKGHMERNIQRAVKFMAFSVFWQIHSFLGY